MELRGLTSESPAECIYCGRPYLNRSFPRAVVVDAGDTSADLRDLLTEECRFCGRSVLTQLACVYLLPAVDGIVFPIAVQNEGMDHERVANRLATEHLSDRVDDISRIRLVGNFEVLFQIMDEPSSAWDLLIRAEDSYVRRRHLPLESRVAALLGDCPEVSPAESPVQLMVSLGEEERTDGFLQLLLDAQESGKYQGMAATLLAAVIDQLREVLPTTSSPSSTSAWEEWMQKYRLTRHTVLSHGRSQPASRWTALQQEAFARAIGVSGLPAAAAFPEWDRSRLKRPLSFPELAQVLHLGLIAVADDDRVGLLDAGTALLHHLEVPRSPDVQTDAAYVKCPELAYAFLLLGRRALLMHDIALGEDYFERALTLYEDPATFPAERALVRSTDCAHMHEWLARALEHMSPMRAVAHGRKALTLWSEIGRADGVVGCAVLVANMLVNEEELTLAREVLDQHCGPLVGAMPDAALSGVLVSLGYIEASSEVAALADAGWPRILMTVEHGDHEPASTEQAIGSAGTAAPEEIAKLPAVVAFVSGDRAPAVELGVVPSPSIVRLTNALALAERSGEETVIVLAARALSQTLHRVAAHDMAAWVSDRYLDAALASEAMGPASLAFVFDSLDAMLTEAAGDEPSRRAVVALAVDLAKMARGAGHDLPYVPRPLFRCLVQQFVDHADWDALTWLVSAVLVRSESVISAPKDVIASAALSPTVAARQQETLFPTLSDVAAKLFRSENLPAFIRQRLVSWALSSRYRDAGRMLGENRPVLFDEFVEFLRPASAALVYVPFEHGIGPDTVRAMGGVLVLPSGDVHLAHLPFDETLSFARSVLDAASGTSQHRVDLTTAEVIPHHLLAIAREASIENLLLSPVAEVCWLPTPAICALSTYGGLEKGILGVGALLTNDAALLKSHAPTHATGSIVHAGLESVTGDPLGFPLQAGRYPSLRRVRSSDDFSATVNAICGAEVFSFFGHVEYEGGPGTASIVVGAKAVRVWELFDALRLEGFPRLVLFWGCGAGATDTWSRWRSRELDGPAPLAIAAGASVFVGPLWRQTAGVLNELGALVTAHILAGESVGRAVARAMGEFRRRHPTASWRDWGCLGVFGNPAWRLASC